MKPAILTLALLTLAFPALAGEKANPYQVFYSDVNGDLRILNGMNVDINVTLSNSMFAHTYLVRAHADIVTEFAADIDTTRQACVAPATAQINYEPGNDGFVCK